MSIVQSLLAKVCISHCEGHVVAEHDGIKLCDANGNDTDNRAFVQITKDALSLIARVDLQRYHRVKKCIRYIINEESYSSGQYLWDCVCLLDFGRFDFDTDHRWGLYMYAATIVHEATHGYLRARGIRRNRGNWKEIERICRTEENLFLKRIGSPWGAKLQKPFNPKAWDVGSIVARLRTLFHRREEEEAKARRPHALDGSEANADRAVAGEKPQGDVRVRADDPRSDWYIPPEWRGLLGVYYVLIPSAILTAMFFSALRNARQGDRTLLWVALAVGAVGVVLLFLARLPLYRRGMVLSFGPRALPSSHRKLYWTAYGFIATSIVIMGLLLRVLQR